MSTAHAHHRRDYFETSVEVAPPSLQALAALAAAVALAFAGHHFVPVWSVIVVLILSTFLLVSSSIWSWRARHLLLDRAAHGSKEHRRRSEPDTQIWFWGGLIISLILSGLGVYILINGLRPNPNFSSPYDGMDPQTSPCLSSAVRISQVREPVLRDSSNHAVGQVELIRSTNCSTVWGRAVLTKQGGLRVKNDTISITIMRPGDNVTVPFAIPLEGHDVAYGSMLSDAQSCVQAQVTLRSPHSNVQGPVAMTACR